MVLQHVRHAGEKDRHHRFVIVGTRISFLIHFMSETIDTQQLQKNVLRPANRQERIERAQKMLGDNAYKLLNPYDEEGEMMPT